MELLNYYWSVYIQYIQDPFLWLSFAPCTILWVYLWNNKRYGETLLISLPFTVSATILFWSKW